MFYHIIASYVDDNIPYTSSSNLGAVIIKLEKSTNTLHQWYRSNIMTANAGNSHLLVTGDYEASPNINDFLFSNIIHFFVKKPFKTGA